MIHTCKVCGKQFESDKKRAAVCYECRTAVCVVCGKRFEPTNKGQLTCSQKCSGIRKSQLGISAKAATTRPTEMKECKFCGKKFLPKTFRQVYCEGPHYKPCPVCGKLVEIKTPSDPAVTCSKECQKVLTQSTCLEKYGNVNVLNSDYGRQKSKESCLEKYGVEHYTSTEQFKQSYHQTVQERYGVDYPLQNPDVVAKMRATNLERYGVEVASQSDEVKAKTKDIMAEKYGGCGLASEELRTRITATNLEKYGSESPFGSSEVREKAKQTNLEKYGHENVGQVPEIRAKIEATNIEKYGVKSPMQCDEVKARVSRSMQDKYGVSNIMELQEYVDKAEGNMRSTMIERYGQPASILVPELRDKINKTITERYGVPWYMWTKDFQDAATCTVSKINLQFRDLLKRSGIESELEFFLSYTDADEKPRRFYYDFKVQDNVLIDIDPTCTHNVVTSPWGDPVTDSYHFNRTEVALKNGYRCIHVFEWDDWHTILKMILPKQSIAARKCKIVKVSQKDVDSFTSANHIQGKCKGQVVNYGLQYNGELIQVMSFGKPRYAHEYDFELLRLCSIDSLRVVGGASKLFKAFIAEHPDASVISYCNLAKFSGTVYERIGMRLDHISPPAKIWSKGKKYITDNLLRQRGFDQLFNTSFGKGTSNEALMLADHWLPVYDCGQAVYTYNN